MPSGNSSKPDSLSTDCVCGHTLNWHMTGALARDCTVTACDCESFEKPENVHRWKRCDQCRHPEHSSACTVCRCLAVTSLEEMRATCRSAGGCPEHPLPLLDFPSEEARLRHHRDCEDCDVLDPCPCCGVRIAVKEKPYVWHSDGSRCEDTASCGRFHAREQPAKRAELPPIEGPEYAPCACGHIEPEHDFQALRCYGDRCKCTRYAIEVPKPPQPERRPPYAVAYSAGGHAYEVLLPGDAVVSAVDGRLVIEHQGFPVLAIERVMPVAVQKEAS